jgi:hypothetical protein
LCLGQAEEKLEEGNLMARDAAVVVSWTRAVPGREAKSFEAFREALEWWGKQAAEGRCGLPRAFGAADASGGMLIIEGRSDGLYELMESEAYRKLASKGVMVADDFRVKLYYGGSDAELQQSLAILTQAMTELGDT